MRNSQANKAIHKNATNFSSKETLERGRLKEEQKRDDEMESRKAAMTGNTDAMSIENAIFVKLPTFIVNDYQTVGTL